MELANKKIIRPHSSNLEFIASHLDPADDGLTAACHALAGQLQQTLDASSMLEMFCEQATKLVPCQSVAFRNDEQNLFIYHGEKHQHICHYFLEVEQDKLGYIECSSKRPFTEKELMRLEQLLTSLAFPLRNALMYHAALRLAYRDPLTQVANRSAFDVAIQTEISRAQRHGIGLCMLVVDIDHFKSINDTYGHLAGDQVLKNVAEKLNLAIRKEDMLFRIGGEEFVILLNATDLPNARLTAERIRMQITAEKITTIEIAVPVTVSVGVSQWIKDENANTLFHRTDQALYAAKSNGRNQVRAA